MTLTPGNVFLLDGCGAVVSTLLLGGVLPAIQPWIGMPLNTLYLLAVIPMVYGVYSFTCYRFVEHRNPIWLQGIMAANLLYCLLTTALVVHHFDALTTLGVAWFVVDALVIVGVVWLERSVWMQISNE